MGNKLVRRDLLPDDLTPQVSLTHHHVKYVPHPERQGPLHSNYSTNVTYEQRNSVAVHPTGFTLLMSVVNHIRVYSFDLVTCF